jgi:hypothetical protein
MLTIADGSVVTGAPDAAAGQTPQVKTITTMVVIKRSRTFTQAPLDCDVSFPY